MRRLLAIAGLVGMLTIASMWLATAPPLPASGASIVIRKATGSPRSRRLEAAGLVRSALLFR
jgi:hypothetical protein